MTEFKMIPLKSVQPDPNQPRKYYDEVSMQELTESVKEKGVLQPILVRPKGQGYILVCGERRFKAATAAGLTELPAMIRVLSDEETLELQIIENLQRKDVHPLEEAVAFKSLADKGKDIKEIAARVGKSEFYARQRMKLVALTAEWQKLFFENRLPISQALKICLFDPKVQTTIYNKDARGRSGTIDLNSWTMRSYQGSLIEAPFDLNDATLDKKMGACTGCVHNSATALLFPESGVTATCTNLACFKGKADNHFAREFEAAQLDPAMIFVTGSYEKNEQDKFVVKLKKAGHDVITKSSYRVEEKPEAPMDFAEWDTESYDHEHLSEEKKRAVYEADEVVPYQKNLEEYERKIAGGKYKKAFVVCGDDKGKYIYVTISKTSSASSGSSAKTKEKEKSGKLTAADIDAEIKRIQEREKRRKEIDENDIWANLHQHFNPVANSGLLKGEFSPLERRMIAMALSDKLDFTDSREFDKQFSFTDKNGKYPEVDEVTLRQMLRHFALAVIPPAALTYGFRKTDVNVHTSLEIAAAYFPSVLDEIKSNQADIAKKRNERIDKRIEQLRAQKKTINAGGTANKTATKKAPPKKAAAKKK